jgi:NodT family efflux transporter outer membrane factor (OMF) lipoprotein
MLKAKLRAYLGCCCLAVIVSACKAPDLVKTESKAVPARYLASQDTTNTAAVKWQDYFTDPYLVGLIDTALRNNQELNITLQEIEVAKNEVRARKGEYLPFVGVGATAGVDKVSRFTSQGASDAATEIEPGRPTPDVLPNYVVGAYASWQVDIWRKLRNAKKSALIRYWGTIEGRNFMVTKLVAEIANSYYELLALDSQLEILKRNIDIQTNALEIVKLEKISARVTELAVRRFQAQVLRTQELQFDIRQKIVETENRINFLVGRFPRPVQRRSDGLINLLPNAIQAGIPSQLLQNRPDIKRAEFDLAAAKLDVKVARANFYPSLNISAAVGLGAFNPAYLVRTPEAAVYSVAGGLTAPLVNRNAIKALYYSANAKRVQAVYNYERSVLNAYVEVVNQLAKIENLRNSYEFKSNEVDALTQSTDIATDLFKSARANYMEVLLTQRDALESRFELIEIKRSQMNAMVNIYQALGGGWKQ